LRTILKKRERKEIAIMSIDLEPGKIVKGAGGAILEDVPHITDWLPDLPTYANPLKYHPAYAAVRQYFVEENDVVAKDVSLITHSP
jgi:6-phosphofructokinase 1